MLKRFKIIVLLLSLSVTVFLMNHTYSRYVSSSTNNIETSFAKWQILVNNEDIANESSSEIEFNPVIEENEFVRDGKMAPSSKGYFDIEIDSSNTDVAFEYNLEFEILNDEIPDIVISKFGIYYDDSDGIILNDLEDLKITNNVLVKDLDKTFTIRVYFEWINDELKTMSNEDQTEVGINALNEEYKLEISAKLNFSQLL